MGKGGGGTAAGRIAGDYAQQLAQMSGPARKLYFGQLNEALTKGTIAQRTPIIQQMVQQGLHEGSRAMTMTREQIAQAGGAAARSPYAAETIASQRAMAEESIGAIPSEVVSAAALRAPQDTMQAVNVANSLLGTAGIAQSQQQQAAAAGQATTMSAAGAGVGVAVAIIAAI